MDIEAGRAELEQQLSGSTEDLYAEIARLTAANRVSRDRDLERRLLWVRHLAGIGLTDEHNGVARFPYPSTDHFAKADGLPEIAFADVTAARVRGAILRDGCLIVRGIVERAEALAFADQIDRAFDERDRKDSSGPTDPAYYEVFQPKAPFQRPWVNDGGAVLAVDSPRVAFGMMEMLGSTGVLSLVAEYLGEPSAFALQKTTLRKVKPTAVGAWHQDGAFMGPVRSLNVWLSLSRAGDEAPGLDIVPRRLDELVPTGTEGTYVKHQVSQTTAEAAAGDLSIVRPVFEPGDALLFDDLCLHRTGADPSMANTRYAVESWFFGGSGFPSMYAPIAV